MSDRFADRAAVAGNIAWEGGIWGALEYGIKAEDMPEGDPVLQARWANLRDAFKQAQLAWKEVQELLPEVDG